MSHGAEATDTDYAQWNMLHLTNDAKIIKQFPSLINKASCGGKYTIMKGELSEQMTVFYLLHYTALFPFRMH